MRESRRQGEKEEEMDFGMSASVEWNSTLDKRSTEKTLVVATIRMGFGHHRLA
jgi:hypothetical protein